MPYPVITPEFFGELTDRTKIENEFNEYTVLFSPAAVEYVFPLRLDAVLKKLMECRDTIAFKMTNLKPEAESEYSQKGQALIKNTPVLKYYWPVKVMTMNAIQNRTYSFEERMLLLNFIYRTAQNMIDQGKPQAINSFMADFTGKNEHPEIMAYFSKLKPVPLLSLGNGLSFIHSMPDNGDFDKIKFSCFKAMGIDPKATEAEADPKKYDALQKKYREEFLPGREHYIENIMVNYVWSYCMPFADYKLSLWENYQFFCVLYNAIKVMLTLYTPDRSDKDDAFFNAMKAFDTSLAAIPGSVVRVVTDTLAREKTNNNGDMAILAIS